MLITPNFMELMRLAADTLNGADIPAVIFIDTQTNATIAESARHFSDRPDFTSARYKILLRICEEFYAHCLRLANDEARHVIDISPKHFEPHPHLQHSRQ